MWLLFCWTLFFITLNLTLAETAFGWIWVKLVFVVNLLFPRYFNVCHCFNLTHVNVPILHILKTVGSVIFKGYKIDTFAWNSLILKSNNERELWSEMGRSNHILHFANLQLVRLRFRDSISYLFCLRFFILERQRKSERSCVLTASVWMKRWLWISPRGHGSAILMLALDTCFM